MTQEQTHVPLAEIVPTIMPGQIEHIGDYVFESEFSDGSPAPTHEVAMNQSTGDYPSREEFEGPYGFSLVMQWSDNCPKKSWEYSASLNKLFIKIGCFVPIQFRVNPHNSSNLKIRALLVFDTVDYVSEPVVRCPVHRVAQHKCNQEYPNYTHLNHVLSCKHRSALYETNERNGRYSVLVPLDDPQPGASFVTLLYGLMCKSSCEGGINRRSTSIIFTLEENHNVIGRQVVKVRVCSCPKRDKQQELSQDDSRHHSVTSRGKKRKINDNNKVKSEHPPDLLYHQPQHHYLQPEQQLLDDPLLFVEVRNKHHYQVLLRHAYDLYRQRVTPRLSMYERLIQQADQL